MKKYIILLLVFLLYISIGINVYATDYATEQDVTENTQDLTGIQEDIHIIRDNIESSSYRVAELYSINNSINDCFYKPLLEDIPYLPERVMYSGNYAVTYSGFYNLDNSREYRPSDITERACELLGYDILLKNENYDIDNKEYTYLYCDDVVDTKTAIMNIYKSLKQYEYEIVHYGVQFDIDKTSTPIIQSLPTNPSNLTAFKEYVFVTRTNPELYIRKALEDLSLSSSFELSNTITNIDFICIVKELMHLYGEPIITKEEMNKLLQVYGAQVPTELTPYEQECWLYLKSRGILEVDVDMYENLTRYTMLDILMRVYDKSSRADWKLIQLTFNINDDLQSLGYFPRSVILAEDKISMRSEIDYSTAVSYDYLIEKNNDTTFTDINGNEIQDIFITDTPDKIGRRLDGTYYKGIEDGYYHFIVQCNPLSTAITSNGCLVINSSSITDRPREIYLPVGGGIYTISYITEEAVYMKRNSFNDDQYKYYCDKERKNGLDATEQLVTEYINKQSLWNDIEEISNGEWILSNDVWYYIKEDGNYLTNGIYSINSYLYCFGTNGKMITGRTQTYNGYVYFNSSGEMLFNVYKDGIYYDSNGIEDTSLQMNDLYNDGLKVLFGEASIVDASSGILHTMNGIRITYTIDIGNINIDELKNRIIKLDNKAIVEQTELENVYKISTILPEQKINSLLSLKGVVISDENSLGYNSIAGKQQSQDVGTVHEAIGNLDGDVLIKYDDLVKKGLFMQYNNEAYPTPINNILKLHTRDYGIVLLNSNNNTIMVGNIIYKIPSNIKLYSYDIVDGKSVLYVDFRVAFGWSADKISWNIRGTGNTYSINICPPDKSLQIQDILVQTDNSDTMFSTKIINNINEGDIDRKYIILSSNYVLSNYVIVTNIDVSTNLEKDYLFVYYPSDYYTIVNNEELKPLNNGSEIMEKILGYSIKYDNYILTAYEINRNMQNEVGKISYNKNIGFIYSLPNFDEFTFNKYLSGEFLLPIVDTGNNRLTSYNSNCLNLSDNTTVIHNSNIEINNSKDIISVKPALVGVPLSVMSGNMVNIELSLDKLQLGSLLNSMASTYVVGSIVCQLKYNRNNDTISLTYPISNGMSTVIQGLPLTTKIFIIDVISGQNYVYSLLNKDRIYAMSSYSKDYEQIDAYSFMKNTNRSIYNLYDELRKKSILDLLDDGTSFILLLTIYIIPMILFSVGLIIVLLAMTCEWKLFRVIYSKYFDPIKLFSFGMLDCEKVVGNRFLILRLLVVTTIAFMLSNGVFFRILEWIFELVNTFIIILSNNRL